MFSLANESLDNWVPKPASVTKKPFVKRPAINLLIEVKNQNALDFRSPDRPAI
jgi:hypothetical protein